MDSFSRKEDSFLRLTETSLSPKQNAKVTEILAEHETLLLKLHYGAENICGPFHLCGTEKFCGAEKLCKYTYLELYNLMMAYMIAKGAMENNAPDDLTYDEVIKLEEDFHANWAKTFGSVLTEDLRVVCCEWYRVVYVNKDMLRFSSLTADEGGCQYCEIDVNKYFVELFKKIYLDSSLTPEARDEAIRNAIKEEENFEQTD